MYKKTFVTLAILAFLALPLTSMATVLTFTDTNGDIDVATWDWAPGNALAVNSVPLSADASAPTAFDIYYQASLSAFIGTNGNAIGGIGLNSDYEITLQAGFSELGSRVDYTDTNSPLNTADDQLVSYAQFGHDSNGSVSFFNIMYDDYTSGVQSDSLSGTGFDDGISLMSGTIVDSTGYFTVILDDGLDNGGVFVDVTALDGFGTNDYPDVYTLEGQGSADVEAVVDVADVNSSLIDTTGFDQIGFFLEIFTNSSLFTPFGEQNPSASVVGQTPNFGLASVDLDGDGVADTDPASVNGFGNPFTNSADFLFQADGNSSVNVVPEPSTLLLLGAGLAGLGFYSRRRK